MPAPNLRSVATGAAAGAAATVPMTALMLAAHRRLPERERYPLPPRLLTDRMMPELTSEPKPGGHGLTGVALVNHFGYGAAAGALYPAVRDRVPGPPVATGIAYGLAVFAGSYFGYLPALGLIRRADRWPRRRAVLTAAAHVVWGAALGVATHALAPPEQERRSDRRTEPERHFKGSSA